MMDIFSIAKDRLNINNSIKFSNDKVAIFYYEDEPIEYVCFYRHDTIRVIPKVVIVTNHINTRLDDFNNEIESEFVDVKVIIDEKNYNFKIYYNKIINNNIMFGSNGRYTTSYFYFKTEE